MNAKTNPQARSGQGIEPGEWQDTLLGAAVHRMSRSRRLATPDADPDLRSARKRAEWLAAHPPQLFVAGVLRVLRSATVGRRGDGSIPVLPQSPDARSGGAVRRHRYHELIAVWAIGRDNHLTPLRFWPRRPVGGHPGGSRIGSLREALVSSGWRAKDPVLVVDDRYLDFASIQWLGHTANCLTLLADPGWDGRQVPGVFAKVSNWGWRSFRSQFCPKDSRPGVATLQAIGNWCKGAQIKRYRISGNSRWQKWAGFLAQVEMAGLRSSLPISLEEGRHLEHRRFWIGPPISGKYPAIGSEDPRGAKPALIADASNWRVVSLLWDLLSRDEVQRDVAKALRKPIATVARECGMVSMLLPKAPGMVAKTSESNPSSPKFELANAVIRHPHNHHELQSQVGVNWASTVDEAWQAVVARVDRPS